MKVFFISSFIALFFLFSSVLFSCVLIVYEDSHALFIDSTTDHGKIEVLREILPNTFCILNEDVNLIGYSFHKSEEYSLESFYTNFKEFFFQFKTGERKKVKLISEKPLILEDEEGMVYFQPEGTPIFPGKPSIDEKNYIILNLKNSNESRSLKYCYMIKGLSWSSENDLYMLNNETAMLFSKFILKSSISEELKDVDLYLLSGNVRVPEKHEMRMMYKFVDAEEKEKGGPGVSEIGKGYDLYHAGKVEILKPHDEIFISNFSGKVNVRRKFIFHNLSSDFSNVFLTLQLIKLPFNLPKGNLRIFEFKEGLPVLIGWVENDRVSKGGDLELIYGRSEKLVGRKVILSEERISKKLRRRRMEIELKNYKEEAVKVEVVEWIPTTSKLHVEDGIKYERRSSTEVVFHVEIPANGERKFEYEIEYSY